MEQMEGLAHRVSVILKVFMLVMCAIFAVVQIPQIIAKLILQAP